jgi:hypothetical protein
LVASDSEEVGLVGLGAGRPEYHRVACPFGGHPTKQIDQGGRCLVADAFLGRDQADIDERRSGGPLEKISTWSGVRT